MGCHQQLIWEGFAKEVFSWKTYRGNSEYHRIRKIQTFKRRAAIWRKDGHMHLCTPDLFHQPASSITAYWHGKPRNIGEAALTHPARKNTCVLSASPGHSAVRWTLFIATPIIKHFSCTRLLPLSFVDSCFWELQHVLKAILLLTVGMKIPT